MEFLQDLFALIGRVLISGMFLWGVFEKLKHWQTSLNVAKSQGIPHSSTVMPIGMGLKILGALLVLFGWHAHIGALLLLIAAIPYLYWMHRFWEYQGTEQMVQRVLFIKELGIIGGLFLLLAMGGGHFSIDGG